ncbi:hypothetical protein NT6N_33670 [Oceaniferula spumae]|uniref:Tetratricopeptide repeat protein n=1 Tax=Oceaniferula spumae TaxID=2979115 RepID=A0AAT9FR07_9BACT
MTFRTLLPCLALVLTPVAAQEKGTCRCCELGRVYAPYLTKLPVPQRRDNIGNSHLKITTSSERAQQWFDQGLNLLHAFWEFEAYRCFLQAAKEDPDCAMAYWGICMSLPGKNIEASEERKAALVSAQKLAVKASDQEKLYIDMVAKLIRSGSSSAVPALEKITQQFPDDLDALAFRCLWLRDGYNGAGKPNRGTQEAITLLQAGLKKHPKHTGLNHYLIHVLEQGPDFEQARSAAIALPQTAPGAGHLVHMPGHIYYLAGEYEKACAAFRACHQVESAYLTKEEIPAVDNNNYIHNLHYLVYAAADQGRYKEALNAAAILAKTSVPKQREKSQGAHRLHYVASTATALVHMRAGHYDAAAASLIPDSLPAGSGARHYVLFLRSYCHLRHSLALPNEPNSAEILRREKLALSRHFKALESSNPPPSPESQSWSLAYTACKILLSESRAWLDNVGKEPGKFSETWAKMAIREFYRSGHAEPPLLITPVSESLGWLALQTGNPKIAREYFQESLRFRRQCGHAYLGLARSFASEGDTRQAAHYYHKCITAFAAADTGLDALAEAKQYIADHPIK